MRELDLACESFRKILEEQLLRLDSMKEEKKDFSTQKVVAVGLIDGDGIGPIIMEQATEILKTLLAHEIAAGSVILRKIEGLTIENRLAKNSLCRKRFWSRSGNAMFC